MSVIHNERLVVVLDQSHAIRSATVFPIEWFSETDARQLPPRDLVGSELVDLATLFSAATVAERDSLSVQLEQAKDDLAAAVSAREQLEQQVTELQSEIDSLMNPPVNPRHVAPFVFLGLLKPEEIVAMQTSNDPIVIVGRSKLQTIITYIDLDHADTQGLVNYMESSRLIANGRAARILAGEPFE